MKSFNEILKELKIKQEKYNNCKHDLEDELCGFMTLGRFLILLIFQIGRAHV